MNHFYQNDRARLRVCHVAMLFKPYFSGHGVYLERVIKILSMKNINNIVLTSNYDNLLSHELVEGIPVHRLRMKSEYKKLHLIFTLRAIPHLCKNRHEFDIIHLHGLWDIYGLFTAFCKVFGKKLILHMVLLGSDDPLAIQESFKFVKWRFKFLSLTNAFISISSPISQNYTKTCLPKDRLYQIPQGVDTDKFSPVSEDERTEIRENLRLPKSKKIVSFVGAIIERKGVDILVDSWIEINKKVKDAILLLIGPDTSDGFDGADADKFNQFVNGLKNQIHENHLDVRFLGKQENVDLFLKASDIFVLPSRHEGFGNVVIEAMSTGLPVVVTEMNGVAKDLIVSGEHGFIVHDSRELVDKLIFLLQNHEEIKRMGSSSRKRALEKFDLRKVCDEYIEVYDKS